MGLKEVLQRFGERRRKLKEFEEELRMRRIAEERMKSSQERDLEEHIEKERQKRIKEKLNVFKKRDIKEFWKSPYKQKLKPQRNGLSLKGNFLGGGIYLK